MKLLRKLINRGTSAIGASAARPAPATADERERQAKWGQVLVAIGQALTHAGTSMVADAHGDAEAWIQASGEPAPPEQEQAAAGEPAAGAERPHLVSEPAAGG